MDEYRHQRFYDHAGAADGEREIARFQAFSFSLSQHCQLQLYGLTRKGQPQYNVAKAKLCQLSS